MNLSIQTVILFNARVVLSTQCLMMLTDYVIMLKTYVVFSTQYPIMLKHWVILSIQLVIMQMGVLFCVYNSLLCQKTKIYVKKLGYIVYEVCELWGWSGGAKVSCILCHRGVKLILAYSWARPAVMFLFLLFLHFHSCSSFFPVPLFHLFCYLFCLFSPFLWETTQNDP